MQIYVSSDGQQYGPYSVEQLREYLTQGSFAPSDFACPSGNNEWVTIEQILQTPVPTATSTVPSPQDITNQTSYQMQDLLSENKGRRLALWISIFLSLVAILAVAIFMIVDSDENTEDVAVQEKGIEKKDSPKSNFPRQKPSVKRDDTKIIPPLIRPMINPVIKQP